MTTLIHWIGLNTCPKCRTLSKIEMNFRVVVIVVHMMDEKQWMVKKMNTCPAAAVAFSNNIHLRAAATFPSLP